MDGRSARRRYTGCAAMARAIDSHGVLTGSFLLDERELVEWGGLCGVLQVEPGRLLLSEGEPVECVYLIQDGEVELYCRRGRRRVVLQNPAGGRSPRARSASVPSPRPLQRQGTLGRQGRSPPRRCPDLAAGDPSFPLPAVPRVPGVVRRG